jgi:hypothetical protein
VDEFWLILGQMLAACGSLLVLIAKLLTLVAAKWALLLVLIAWCLWGVNWGKIWPVLAAGAWLPLALLAIIGALAWSQIAPGEGNFLGLTNVPNFWWQLGDVALILLVALLCGYVQQAYDLTPAEIDLEPAAAPTYGHGHH